MFKTIIKTATFKQSQITVLGTIINGVLGAIFYILLARFLGPSNFGLFTVSVATLTLIADSVDFGANTGLVRYVSRSLTEDKDKALRFLKLSLEFKSVIWVLVLIIGMIISPIIAINIFNKSELVSPLRLVMIGVGGALLFSFATSATQAFQKFFVWGFINIITNLFRVILIILFFYLGSLDLSNSLLTYIMMPFIGFFLGLLFIPSEEMFKVKKEFSVAKQLFKYNIWVGIFSFIAAFSARLDTFLTARLLSSFQLGIYGAANQLVQVVPQLISALGMVAAPKFSAFTNKQSMLDYLKKFQLMVLGLSLVGVLAIPVCIYLIPIIFGVEYSTVVSPFVILLIAMLVFLISVPIHNSIIYYFGKPQVFVWVSIGHLLIVSLLGYWLISNYGVVGAAITVLVGTLFNFLVPLGWFLIKIRK